MSSEDVTREQLLELLEGGHAHMPFEQAVAEFPPEAMNRRPPQVPYTPWQLLEHMRIAQWDILAFIQDPSHESPKWPDGYWPRREAEVDVEGWERTLEQFRRDGHALRQMAADPGVDLTAPLAHAPGYTILRELLVVADHNAYHIGEFAILRQVMGTWQGERADPKG